MGERHPRVADKEVAHEEHQGAELRGGKTLVATPAEGDDQGERVAGILKKNGGHFIHRYGRWAVQRLEE